MIVIITVTKTRSFFFFQFADDGTKNFLNANLSLPDKRDTWSKVQVPLQASPKQAYKVLLEVGGQKAILYIDDITVVDETCNITGYMSSVFSFSFRVAVEV